MSMLFATQTVHPLQHTSATAPYTFARMVGPRRFFARCIHVLLRRLCRIACGRSGPLLCVRHDGVRL